MNKVTVNKQSLLRVLLAVYVFPLLLVVFSLSVPAGDVPLCGLMFVLALFGFMLARREPSMAGDLGERFNIRGGVRRLGNCGGQSRRSDALAPKGFGSQAGCGSNLL